MREDFDRAFSVLHSQRVLHRLEVGSQGFGPSIVILRGLDGFQTRGYIALHPVKRYPGAGVGVTVPGFHVGRGQIRSFGC
jgi:hypothetical protein